MIDLEDKTYLYVILWLTGIYFIVEILINILVFKQLSIKSDYLTIEGMEFWGKIITGLGAGLALTKAVCTNFKVEIFPAIKSEVTKLTSDRILIPISAIQSLWLLLLSLVVCIPLSFYLQNKLIDKLVESSTPEERNKAVLIVNTHATMKPHYNPNTEKEPSVSNKLLLPIGGVKDFFVHKYTQKQNILFAASQDCIEASSEALGVTSNIDKAFFSYNAFHSPLNEKLYIDTITTYHECLTESNVYKKFLIPKPEFDDTKLREFYKKYQKEAEKLNEPLNRASRSIWSASARQKVMKAWSKEASKFLGFESNLPPFLSYEDFLKHPDIQQYQYINYKGGGWPIVPHMHGFEDRLRVKMIPVLNELLPNKVIPSYVREGSDEPMFKSISYPDKYKGEKIELTDEQMEKIGKQAYKAIVMPIVALGASLTFLILNLAIVISQLVVFIVRSQLGVEKGLRVLNFILSLTLVSLILAAPLLSKDEAKTVQSDTWASKAVGIIYHYENILAKLTGNANKSIVTESYKIGQVKPDPEPEPEPEKLPTSFNVTELEIRSVK